MILTGADSIWKDDLSEGRGELRSFSFSSLPVCNGGLCQDEGAYWNH